MPNGTLLNSHQKQIYQAQKNLRRKVKELHIRRTIANSTVRLSMQYARSFDPNDTDEAQFIGSLMIKAGKAYSRSAVFFGSLRYVNMRWKYTKHLLEQEGVFHGE